jgi:hypothetical protein
VKSLLNLYKKTSNRVNAFELIDIAEAELNNGDLTPDTISILNEMKIIIDKKLDAFLAVDKLKQEKSLNFIWPDYYVIDYWKN